MSAQALGWSPCGAEDQTLLLLLGHVPPTGPSEETAAGEPPSQ